MSYLDNQETYKPYILIHSGKYFSNQKLVGKFKDRRSCEALCDTDKCSAIGFQTGDPTNYNRCYLVPSGTKSFIDKPDMVNSNIDTYMDCGGSSERGFVRGDGCLPNLRDPPKLTTKMIVTHNCNPLKNNSTTTGNDILQKCADTVDVFSKYKTGYQFTENKDVAFVDSKKSCEVLCMDDPKCMGISFQKDGVYDEYGFKRCLLANSINNYSESPHFDTYIKSMPVPDLQYNVDTKCMNAEISKLGKTELYPNDYVPIMIKCKQNKVEPFTTYDSNLTYISQLIMLIILIYLIVVTITNLK